VRTYIYNINKINSNIESLIKNKYPKRYESAKRLKNHNDYLRSIGAFYLLDTILGVFNEEDYITSLNGKPYINGKNEFSISHCGELVSLIVSDKPIGLDIQIIEDKVPSNLNKICSNEEIEQINNKNEMFFMTWTRKEAIIKLLGESILSKIKDINTTNDIVKHNGSIIYLCSTKYKASYISIAYYEPVTIELIECE